MTSTTMTFHVAVCLGLLLGNPVVGRADASKAPNALDAAAAQTNLEHIRSGYQVGLNTPMQVSEATAMLAVARIRDAVAQNKADVVVSNLAIYVAQQQELLKQTQSRFDVGLTDARSVNAAQDALAAAQVSADLYSLWTVRERASVQTQTLWRTGLVSASEADKASAAARKVLAQFSDSLPGASAP